MSKKSGAGIVKKPYTGILLEPLAPHWEYGGPLLKKFALPAEKINALFDHFGFERGDWRSLALELAFHHVPGFQIAGAPPKHPPARQIALIIAVQKHKDEGKTVSEACRLLEREVRGAARNAAANARTLEREYYAALKDKDVVRQAGMFAERVFHNDE